MERGRQSSSVPTLLVPSPSVGKKRNSGTNPTTGSRLSAIHQSHEIAECHEIQSEHYIARVSELRARKERKHRSPVRKLLGLFKKKKSYEERMQKYDEASMTSDYSDDTLEDEDISLAESKEDVKNKEKSKLGIPFEEKSSNHEEYVIPEATDDSTDRDPEEETLSGESELSLPDWLELCQHYNSEEDDVASFDYMEPLKNPKNADTIAFQSYCSSSREKSQNKFFEKLHEKQLKSSHTEPNENSGRKHVKWLQVESLQSLLVDPLENLHLESWKNCQVKPHLAPPQSAHVEPSQSSHRASKKSQSIELLQSLLMDSYKSSRIEPPESPHSASDASQRRELQKSFDVGPLQSSRVISAISQRIEPLQSSHMKSQPSSHVELPQSSRLAFETSQVIESQKSSDIESLLLCYTASQESHRVESLLSLQMESQKSIHVEPSQSSHAISTQVQSTKLLKSLLKESQQSPRVESLENPHASSMTSNPTEPPQSFSSESLQSYRVKSTLTNGGSAQKESLISVGTMCHRVDTALSNHLAHCCSAKKKSLVSVGTTCQRVDTAPSNHLAHCCSAQKESLLSVGATCHRVDTALSNHLAHCCSAQKESLMSVGATCHRVDTALSNHLAHCCSTQKESLLSVGTMCTQCSDVSHMKCSHMESYQNPCKTTFQCPHMAPRQRPNIEPPRIEPLTNSHASPRQSLCSHAHLQCYHVEPLCSQVPRLQCPYTAQPQNVRKIANQSPHMISLQSPHVESLCSSTSHQISDGGYRQSYQLGTFQSSPTGHPQGPIARPLRTSEITVLHSSYKEPIQSDHPSSCESFQMENRQIKDFVNNPPSAVFKDSKMVELQSPQIASLQKKPCQSTQVTSFQCSQTVETFQSSQTNLKSNDGSISILLEPPEKTPAVISCRVQEQTESAVSKEKQSILHHSGDSEENHMLKLQVFYSGKDLSTVQKNWMERQVSGLLNSLLGNKGVPEANTEAEVESDSPNESHTQDPKPKIEIETGEQNKNCLRHGSGTDEVNVQQKKVTTSESTSSTDTYYTVASEEGYSQASIPSEAKPGLCHVAVNQVKGKSKPRAAHIEYKNVPFIHLSPRNGKNKKPLEDGRTSSNTFRFGNNIKGKVTDTDRPSKKSPRKGDYTDTWELEKSTTDISCSDPSSELSTSTPSSHELIRKSPQLRTNPSDCSLVSEESIGLTVPRDMLPLPSSLPPLPTYSKDTVVHTASRRRPSSALTDRFDAPRKRHRVRRHTTASLADNDSSRFRAANKAPGFQHSEEAYLDEDRYNMTKEPDGRTSRRPQHQQHTPSTSVHFNSNDSRGATNKLHSNRSLRCTRSPDNSRFSPGCDRERQRLQSFHGRDLRLEEPTLSRSGLVVKLCDVDQDNRYIISNKSVSNDASDNRSNAYHYRDEPRRSDERKEAPETIHQTFWKRSRGSSEVNATDTNSSFKDDGWPLFSLGPPSVMNDIKQKKSTSSSKSKTVRRPRRCQDHNRHNQLSPKAGCAKYMHGGPRAQFQNVTKALAENTGSKRRDHANPKSFYGPEASKSSRETNDLRQSFSNETPGYFQFKGINFSETSVRIASAPKLNQQIPNCNQGQQTWVPMFGAPQQQFVTPFVSPPGMNIPGYFPGVPMIPNIYGNQGFGFFPHAPTHVPLRFFSPIQQQRATTNVNQYEQGGMTSALRPEYGKANNLKENFDAISITSNGQDKETAADDARKDGGEKTSKLAKTLRFSPSATMIAPNDKPTPKSRKWRQCEKERDCEDAWWMPKDWAKQRGIGSYSRTWEFEKDKVEKQEKELQIAKDANIEQIRMSRFVAM